MGDARDTSHVLHPWLAAVATAGSSRRGGGLGLGGNFGHRHVRIVRPRALLVSVPKEGLDLPSGRVCGPGCAGTFSSRWRTVWSRWRRCLSVSVGELSECSPALRLDGTGRV